MEHLVELKKAIDFEETGYRLYNDAAEKSSNPMVKRTFSYLALQEKKHMEILKDYGEKEHDYIHDMDGNKEIAQFFKMTADEFKQRADVTEDDIAAHEAGLALEKSAYDYYSELFEKTEDEALKRFCRFLMVQERMHYELLDKAYWYAKDPVGFYAEEEQWFVEG